MSRRPPGCGRSRCGRRRGWYRPDHRDLAGVPSDLEGAAAVRHVGMGGGCDGCAGVTRLLTYDVKVDDACRGYCEHIMAWGDMREWFAAASREPEEIEELEVEF